ncbi:MAG: hypothetical protein QG549_731 [Patescibacteria group bacterium]|nr:hypothetical protein [Patescibacteria group bacterium]
MIPFVLRLLWRFIILVLGIAILYLLLLVFWPESGSRLAAFTALLIVYCLMAYIVIPALMRLFHVLLQPDHIPLYVTTRDGWPSDPITIAVIAKNRKQLVDAMTKAGWYTAQPLTFWNGLREVISIIFNTPYPDSPLSHLYLFDRPHDIGFEIPTNSANSARTRHHVRFWRLQEPRTESRNASHYDFWRDKLRRVLHVERQIWIGAATEETHAIDIQWRTGQLTHGGSHEADKERDFIVQTLRDAGVTKRITTSDPGEQFKFRGQQFRTFYITDGSIKIIQLKTPVADALKLDKLKKSN